MSDKLRESMGSKGSKDLESMRLKAAQAQAELAYAETMQKVMTVVQPSSSAVE